MNQPDIICITGGIGSGKSVVSRILRLKGFKVYDCDSRAKALMASPLLKDKLKEILGNGIFRSDGSLDRAAMAAIIFSDDEKRASVNRLVHAEVRADISAEYSLSGSPFFVETAIPATSHLDALCRSIWLVEAPEELRLRRACSRDNACRADIERRIEAQKSEFRELPKEKTAIIANDGSHSILSRIESLLASNQSSK